MGKRIGAVVLAAGRGKRMHSSVAKQFLELNGRPLITYALETFQNSPVDEIILVTGEDTLDYCRKEIVDAYGFSKVTAVVKGGKERYHSVYEGLRAFSEERRPDYVLIHDGARPLISQEVIGRTIEDAIRFQACVAAVPVKDTIKRADADGFAAETPDRKLLWQVQTPQTFSYSLIRDAYEALFQKPEAQECITDDAMVVENMTGRRVRLTEGDYCNLKVTTPEDLVLAEALLISEKRRKLR